MAAAIARRGTAGAARRRSASGSQPGWLGAILPESWIAIVVTGFFQTTINFGSTTMALAGGGAGRTSVLVFTMPFWTLLIAWPVLHERVSGGQWMAIAFALAGLALVVEPWNWPGDLSAKLWAVLSGFGWAAGTIATKYFQRRHELDPLNFIAWQMLIGVLPLTALPIVMSLPGDAVERRPMQCCSSGRARCRRRRDSCCGSPCCGSCRRGRRRSTCSRFR